MLLCAPINTGARVACAVGGPRESLPSVPPTPLSRWGGSDRALATARRGERRHQHDVGQPRRVCPDLRPATARLLDGLPGWLLLIIITVTTRTRTTYRCCSFYRAAYALTKIAAFAVVADVAAHPSRTIDEFCGLGRRPDPALGRRLVAHHRGP